MTEIGPSVGVPRHLDRAAAFDSMNDRRGAARPGGRSEALPAHRGRAPPCLCTDLARARTKRSATGLRAEEDDPVPEWLAHAPAPAGWPGWERGMTPRTKKRGAAWTCSGSGHATAWPRPRITAASRSGRRIAGRPPSVGRGPRAWFRARGGRIGPGSGSGRRRCSPRSGACGRRTPNLGKRKIHPLLRRFCAERGLRCPEAVTIGRPIADAGGLPGDSAAAGQPGSDEAPPAPEAAQAQGVPRPASRAAAAGRRAGNDPGGAGAV